MRAGRGPLLPNLWRWRGLAEAALARDDRAGRAAAQLAEAGWPTEHPAALDLLLYLCADDRAAVEQMLAALPADEAGRSGVRLLRATCAARGLRLAEALEDLPQIVNLARHEANEHLLAWALSGHAMAAALAGRRVESYERLSEAIDVARALGHDTLLALGLCNLGFLYGQDGRPEPFAQRSREALAIFQSLRDVQGATFCLANLGGALVELGALDEAAERLHAGRR